MGGNEGYATIPRPPNFTDLHMPPHYRLLNTHRHFGQTLTLTHVTERESGEERVSHILVGMGRRKGSWRR